MVLNLNKELSPYYFIYTFSISESRFFLGQESWFSSGFQYRLYPKLFHRVAKLLKDCTFSLLAFPICHSLLTPLQLPQTSIFPNLVLVLHDISEALKRFISSSSLLGTISQHIFLFVCFPVSLATISQPSFLDLYPFSSLLSSEHSTSLLVSVLLLALGKPIQPSDLCSCHQMSMSRPDFFELHTHMCNSLPDISTQISNGHTQH